MRRGFEVDTHAIEVESCVDGGIETTAGVGSNRNGVSTEGLHEGARGLRVGLVGEGSGGQVTASAAVCSTVVVVKSGAITSLNVRIEHGRIGCVQ